MRRVRTKLKLLSIAISEDMWIGAFSFPILHWNVNASQPRAMPFVLVDHDFMSWSEQGRGQRGAPFTTPLSFPNSSRRVRVDKRVEIRNWQFGKGQRKDYGHDDLISRLLFPSPTPEGAKPWAGFLCTKRKKERRMECSLLWWVARHAEGPVKNVRGGMTRISSLLQKDQ